MYQSQGEKYENKQEIDEGPVSSGKTLEKNVLKREREGKKREMVMKVDRQ